MSGKDLYAVAYEAKLHDEIVNRSGQVIRERVVMPDEMKQDIGGADKKDMKIPQINANKYKDDPENYMEMRAKYMKKEMKAATENQDMAMHERVMNMDVVKPSAGVEPDEETSEHNRQTNADLDPELTERDMLVRRGRIAVLELINENEVNLHYAPFFLQKLVEQAKETTPDHAQYFLRQIIDEQKQHLDHADEDSLKELIKMIIPMDKKSVTKKWIKEYKENNPLTILTDYDLEDLANEKSIFQEMTSEQMQQYNAEQSQRLEMNIFLYNGLVNGLLLAFGCLMLSSTLDFMFG
ncbi:uncharacterized protein LOC111066366 [Drosophila obscura]|uniref:uncharacterized protein LOC111066366 n=1 Tax=Drosophila obscura TaxID=7282 RepID=UPI001BB209FC|nr:uncharacterized protein LOC111066366 [Drosophila obscura]XP_022210606.2 uncharacterized protein LOC111066366 [Drosophila obscura]XP_022210607.2 uncharacterized protein LOC111066366 [Drosophila obscura]